MEEIRIIEVKQSVFEDNNKDADLLRKELKEKKKYNCAKGGGWCETVFGKKQSGFGNEPHFRT